MSCAAKVHVLCMYAWFMCIVCVCVVLTATIRILLFLVYALAMIGLYIAPLFIQSPCIGSSLPPKPRLLAHKGASAVSPPSLPSHASLPTRVHQR